MKGKQERKATAQSWMCILTGLVVVVSCQIGTLLEAEAHRLEGRSGRVAFRSLALQVTLPFVALAPVLTFGSFLWPHTGAGHAVCRRSLVLHQEVPSSRHRIPDFCESQTQRQRLPLIFRINLGGNFSSPAAVEESISIEPRNVGRDGITGVGVM